MSSSNKIRGLRLTQKVYGYTRSINGRWLTVTTAVCEFEFDTEQPSFCGAWELYCKFVVVTPLDPPVIELFTYEEVAAHGDASWREWLSQVKP